MKDTQIWPEMVDKATAGIQTATSGKPMENIKCDELIVESYNVPERFNLMAAASVWILLAGFVVLPGTFTYLQNTSSLSSSVHGKVVQHTMQNVPLLAFAVVFFITGIAGIGWLWQRLRRQHLWLADRLFLYVVVASTHISSTI